MSSTGSRLAGRYRRLLSWYPRDYRRERGEEMVNVLLELASPQQSRPPIRQRLNLIRNGMRCRLGRPASRTVVAAAVLTSAVCGLFTAAIATRLAWETAQPLPSQAEAKAIFAEVLPEYDLTGDIFRSPAMFVVYQQPVSGKTLDTLLSGDGGEYELGVVSGSASVPSPVELSPVFTGAAQTLRAGGWSIGEVIQTEPDPCVNSSGCPSATPPGRYYKLAARRDPDIVEITVSPDYQAGLTYVSVTISRATPWAVYPAGVAGGLLGAFAGWLVFGWASRRTEHQHILARGMTIVLYRITIVVWWGPILVFGPMTLWHHLHERHLRWHPLWEWLGQPAASLFVLIGCAAACCTLAIAGLSRRKQGLATGIAKS